MNARPCVYEDFYHGNTLRMSGSNCLEVLFGKHEQPLQHWFTENFDCKRLLGYCSLLSCSYLYEYTPWFLCKLDWLLVIHLLLESTVRRRGFYRWFVLETKTSFLSSVESSLESTVNNGEKEFSPISARSPSSSTTHDTLLFKTGR